jgi:hypothetical protein
LYYSNIKRYIIKRGIRILFGNNKNSQNLFQNT